MRLQGKWWSRSRYLLQLGDLVHKQHRDNGNGDGANVLPINCVSLSFVHRWPCYVRDTDWTGWRGAAAGYSLGNTELFSRGGWQVRKFAPTETEQCVEGWCWCRLVMNWLCWAQPRPRLVSVMLCGGCQQHLGQCRLVTTHWATLRWCCTRAH